VCSTVSPTDTRTPVALCWLDRHSEPAEYASKYVRIPTLCEVCADSADAHDARLHNQSVASKFAQQPAHRDGDKSPRSPIPRTIRESRGLNALIRELVRRSRSGRVRPGARHAFDLSPRSLVCSADGDQRGLGVLNADTSLDKAAGYVAFVFAALGIYLFLNIADTAMGGRGYPLGSPLVK
jgi:hypothetical protein